MNAESDLIEHRLAAVETVLADIRRRLDAAPEAVDWIGRLTGGLRDKPAFDEVLRLGREIREQDRPRLEAGA